MPGTFAQMPRTIPADILAEKNCVDQVSLLSWTSHHIWLKLGQASPSFLTLFCTVSCSIHHPTPDNICLLTCVPRLEMQVHSNQHQPIQKFMHCSLLHQTRLNCNYTYLRLCIHLRVFLAIIPQKTFEHSHLLWVSSDFYSYTPSHPPL